MENVGERIVFHGTKDLKTARQILREGFAPFTYFGLNLQDALEFGGEYIFYVALKCGDRNWQPRPSNSVPADRILRLVRVNPKMIYDNDNARTKFFGEREIYPCPNCGEDIGRVKLSIFGKPTKPKCPKCKKPFGALFTIRAMK